MYGLFSEISFLLVCKGNEGEEQPADWTNLVNLLGGRLFHKEKDDSCDSERKADVCQTLLYIQHTQTSHLWRQKAVLYPCQTPAEALENWRLDTQTAEDHVGTLTAPAQTQGSNNVSSSCCFLFHAYQMLGTWSGCLQDIWKAFWVSQTGKDPRTHWRAYASCLASECFGIPRRSWKMLLGKRTSEIPS